MSTARGDSYLTSEWEEDPNLRRRTPQQRPASIDTPLFNPKNPPSAPLRACCNVLYWIFVIFSILGTAAFVLHLVHYNDLCWKLDRLETELADTETMLNMTKDRLEVAEQAVIALNMTVGGGPSEADIMELQANVLDILVCKNSSGDAVSVTAPPQSFTANECTDESENDACIVSWATVNWDDGGYFDAMNPTRINFPRDGRYALGLNCALFPASGSFTGPILGIFELVDPTTIFATPPRVPIQCRAGENELVLGSEPVEYPLNVYCEVELLKQTANYVRLNIDVIAVHPPFSIAQDAEIGGDCTMTMRQIGPLVGSGTGVL